METFTLEPRCWRIARLFGRNPLLRRTDRLEALVMLVALVTSLVAIPIAGVVGVAAYGARDRVYTQEAQERHRVMATVTDAEHEDLGTTVAQAKWPLAAGLRTGTLVLADPVKAGEKIEIWVDKDGTPTIPPTPAWLAAAEAVGMAGVTLLAVAVGMATLVAAIRLRLDRTRDAAWEREIRYLVDDGGRKNRQ
ncbi:Rv1733c family protein [Mycobacterium sp.]|uniref:Rv1733c family protein n=1 Tax=Mycobacterium sp. TaxID=1785 RepID=UPI003C7183D8